MPRTSRRYLLLLLAISAIVPVAEGANLTLASATGSAGATVSVPLSLSTQGAAVSGVAWTLTYSTADFSNVQIAGGQAASQAGKTLSCYSPSAGRQNCVVVGNNTGSLADGAVATVTMTLAAAPSANAQVNLSDGNGVDASGTAVTVTATGASIGIAVPVTLTALSCTPSSVNTGSGTVCTAGLNGPAPAGGVSVALGSSSTQTISATLASSVTVPAGASSATFPVQINSASASCTLTVVGTLYGISKSAPIAVQVATAPSDTTAPTITAVTTTPSSTSAVVRWTTNEASTSIVQYGTSTTALTQTATAAGLTTAHEVTISNLTAATKYYYRITSADAANNSSSSPAAAYAPATFTTAAATVPPAATTLSFWPGAVTPEQADSGYVGSSELGVKFSVDTEGAVAGVRFFRGSTANTGVHAGTLWNQSGQKLATTTFSVTDTTGWQTAYFATPVTLTPGATYVISYYAPIGHTSYTSGFSGIHTGPLHATDGVHAVGASTFPNLISGVNHWADVLFTPQSNLSVPATAAVATGSVQSGNVAALSSNDGKFYTLKSSGSKLSWTASITGVSNTASALSITYSGSNSLSASQTISVWNFSKSIWDTLETRTAGSTETLRVLQVANPAEHIRSGEVRVKVDTSSWLSFTSNIDLLRAASK